MGRVVDTINVFCGPVLIALFATYWHSEKSASALVWAWALLGVVLSWVVSLRNLTEDDY